MTLQAGVEVRFLARLPFTGYRLSVIGQWGGVFEGFPF